MWIQSLFLALLIVIILQGRYFPRRNFKSLRYQRYFTPDIITEGESTTLVEHISNARLLPIPWVRVEAQLSPYLIFGKGVVNQNVVKPDKYRQFHRSLFTLPSYTTITRRHNVTVPHRGYYAVPSVTMTTGDILGIGERRSQNFATNTALTVYPRMIPIDDLFRIRSSFTGDIVVRRWIVDDPFYIRGVREYQPTDPQNRVNWKATAKTGQMQVHNYDYTADVRLMILLNVDTHENQWSITTDEPCAERAVSIAASISEYALSNGVETGFASNGKYIDDPEIAMRLEPCTGDAQLSTILLTLAKCNLWRRVTFHTLLKEEYDLGTTGCDYLVITAYTNKEIEEELGKLRDAGNNVEVLTVEHTPKEDLHAAD
ncbi:MAG: DUF58 domain-containing protein [Clostridiaceae bacterium]|nr:DUF58 domain-containing protein [Clostridiaceae bacterium]